MLKALKFPMNFRWTVQSSASSIIPSFLAGEKFHLAVNILVLSPERIRVPDLCSGDCTLQLTDSQGVCTEEFISLFYQYRKNTPLVTTA